MSFRTAVAALVLIAVTVPASAQVEAVRKDGRLDRDVGATVNAEGFSTDSALITTSGLTMHASARLRTVELVPVHAPIPATPAGMEEGPGTCHLGFDVAADGTVTDARIRRCSSPLYAEALVTAARDWRFEPFRQDGEPAPVTNVRQMVTYNVMGQSVTTGR